MMERTALLLPFILSNLVTTSLSLTCTECYAPGAKSCQGGSVTCPSGFDACVLTIESETRDGKEVTWSRQYCGQKNMCSYTGILATNYGVRKFSSSCCFLGGCAPPLPKLPTEKTDKNGVWCNSCDVNKGKPCDFSSNTMDIMECTGDENKCISMINKTTIGFAQAANSASGCGSPGLCSAAKQVITLGEEKSEITFTCINGPPPPPSPSPSAATAFPPLPLTLLAALYIMKAIL